MMGAAPQRTRMLSPILASLTDPSHAIAVRAARLRATQERSGDDCRASQPARRARRAHIPSSRAQATEAKIRSSLEGKRADAEKRAAETKEKAAKMKSRYEELLKQEETDNDQEVRLQRVAKEKL